MKREALLNGLVCVMIFIIAFSSTVVFLSFLEVTCDLSFVEEASRLYLANKSICIEWVKKDDGWFWNKLSYISGKNCIDAGKTWIDII